MLRYHQPILPHNDGSSVAFVFLSLARGLLKLPMARFCMPFLGSGGAFRALLRPAPAGLFFYLRPRSHTGMDPDLENVIRQALADAKATGRG